MSVSTTPVDPHDVSRGRETLSPRTKVILAGSVMALATGVMIYGMWPHHRGNGGEVRDVGGDAGRPFIMPRLPDAPAQPTPLPMAHTDTPPGTAAAPPGAAPASVAPLMGFWQDTGALNSLGGQAQRTAQAGQAGQEAGRAGPAPAGGPSAAAGPVDTGEPSALMRKAGVTGRAYVGKPFNLHYLLARDTKIHCVPESPLDSDVGGPVDCMVAEPGDGVRSADGTVLLIENGSMIKGEAIKGPEIGSRRMFIASDEILTTRGIPIYFSGSAADTLGTNGVNGFIDDHLWQKLRATLLLSAVEIGGSVATNLAQNSGTTNLNVSSGPGVGLAQTALAHDLNIPSTLWRNQGDPITVIVRQDIPMEAAYKLELVR